MENEKTMTEARAMGEEFNPDFAGEELCECKGFSPMTNADWIRSMTEKELVEFIGHNSLCDRVQGESGNWCNDHNCTDCLEEWLKQPAEVE